MMSAVVDCPYCGGVCEVYWQKAAVWYCLECGLLFRYPQPDAQSLDTYYELGWRDPGQQIISGGTDLELAEVYVKRLLHILQRPDFAQTDLLEFGAGTGAMVTAVADAGANVTAIEPFGYKYLQKKGATVYPDLALLPQRQFDGIYSIQVLEHLLKPWETLSTLFYYLKPGGWLYISTIYAQSLNAFLHRGNWREAQNPGHLYFFTPANLQRLLGDAGYGRIQRVRDFIQYPNRTVREFWQDYLLQYLGLGGELCYLAWK